MTYCAGAAEELLRVWRARRILAVTFPNLYRGSRYAGPGFRRRRAVEWADLSPRQQQFIQSLRDTDLLTTVTGRRAPQALRCSIPLACWS